MTNRKKTHPFFNDIINSPARDNKNFHWSTSYEWFSRKSEEENQTYKIWTTWLVNVGCVPHIFNYRELVSWCAQRFDCRTRMIKVTIKGKNPVLLTLKVFNKMICLPTTNKPFNIEEVDTFLAFQAGGANILGEFVLPSANVSSDLSGIDITLLQEPYQEFSWMFVLVIRQQSTSQIPRSALYAPYFTF